MDGRLRNSGTPSIIFRAYRWPCGFGIHEFLNLCSFSLHLAQVLGTKLLIHRKLLLRQLLLHQVDFVGAKPVARVGQLRTEFKGTCILRNRFPAERPFFDPSYISHCRWFKPMWQVSLA
jgi:hypothetical protein